MSASNFGPPVVELPPAAPRTPVPPREFEPGTILTLRMRGHSRSPVPGSEYFAPAVVLEQFMPNGEISVLIWDSSAGTHYNPSYAIRDVSTRGTGNEREMYVVQENIGQVLFAPNEFVRMGEDIERIMMVARRYHVFEDKTHARLEALESAMTKPEVAPSGATRDKAENQPKVDSKKTS